MLVITMASRKGGVGKSSCARALAVQALIDGIRTAIIDADPQGQSWPGRTARSQGAGGLRPRRNDPRGAPCEFACGQGRSSSGRYATECSSHHRHGSPGVRCSFVVTGPYPDDLSAIGSTVQIAKGQGRGGGIILNRTPSKSTALQLARGALAVFDLPICPTAIVQRVAHPYSSSEGMTAQEWEPGGSAAKEIEEVLALDERTAGHQGNEPAEAADAGS